MAIPNAIVIQLQNKGIITVGDLVDFDKDTIQQIADNLRRPVGRISDPIINAVAVFMRQPLTVPNIHWDPAMRRFKEMWQAIKEC